MDYAEYMRKKFSITDDLARCLLSEFFCTSLLLFGGTATNAQCLLTKGEYGKLTTAVGWSVAVCLAALTGVRISGAHMNPAVSFSNFICGRLSTRRLCLYCLMQTFGAFLGSILTYIMYYEGLNDYDGGVRQVVGPNATLGIFVPLPQPYLSTTGCIVDQIMATAFLCIVLSSICDKRNKVPLIAQPIVCILLVMALSLFCSVNAGGEVNPARDIGPKIMALSVGYGWEVISYRNYTWFLVPIICPFVGAAVGTWIYQFFIGFHMPDDKDLQCFLKKTQDCSFCGKTALPV